MIEASLPPLEKSTASASQFLTLFVEILKDLLLVAYSLLNGQLRIEDLRARVLNPKQNENLEVEPKDTPTSLDAVKELAKSPIEDLKVTSIGSLCKAIAARDFDLASQILQDAPTLAKISHDGRWYAIHTAVLSGDLSLVKLVAGQIGVDVNSRDMSAYDSNSISLMYQRTREEQLSPRLRTIVPYKATALHYACMVGDIDIIKFLLDQGAFIEATDGKNRMPIEYFDLTTHGEAFKAFHVMLGEWQIKKQMIEEVNVSELHRAVRYRDIQKFERLLRRKPEVADRFTYYDFTLLQMATIRQLSPFIKLILDVRPSCVNIKDNRMSSSQDALNSFASDQFPHKHVKIATALHYACLTGNMENIELLLKAGADWNIEDSRGRRPDELICETGGSCLKAEFERLRDEEDARRKEKAASESEKLEKLKEQEEEQEEKENSDKSSPSAKVNSKTSNDDEAASLLKADQDEKKAGLPLEKIIGAKIIGQKGPVRSVSNAIRLRENGWVDPDRPLVMLFLGSSGVGKTELAKQIALYMHGKDGTSTHQGDLVDEIEQEYGFVRIDMSEFQHSHTVSNLTGSPRGYVGYDDEGFLTKRLRKNPKAIVLLDEIEKAHPNVLTVFLQVFDDGRITDSKRGVIYCKDAVFIMTSNLASDEIKEQSPFLRRLVEETEAQGRPEEYMRVVSQFNRQIHPILKRSLKRDEFLGRINQIIVFLPLDEDEISIVINGELKTWKRRASDKHGIKLSWSREAVLKLTKSYDVNYGVRSVMHEVQRIAVQLIADAQIRGDLHEGWHAYLTLNDDGDLTLKAADLKEGAGVRRGCRYIH